MGMTEVGCPITWPVAFAAVGCVWAIVTLMLGLAWFMRRK
jgi:hypothetical protein